MRHHTRRPHGERRCNVVNHRSQRCAGAAYSVTRAGCRVGHWVCWGDIHFFLARDEIAQSVRALRGTSLSQVSLCFGVKHL